jgi:hypothetical protein
MGAWRGRPGQGAEASTGEWDTGERALALAPAPKRLSLPLTMESPWRAN